MVKFKGLIFCGWLLGKDFYNLTLVHMYHSDGEYLDKGKTSQYFKDNICLTGQKFCVDGHKYQIFGRQTKKLCLVYQTNI